MFIGCPGSRYTSDFLIAGFSVSLSSKWDDYKQYGVASFALNKVGLKMNTQGDKV